MLSHPIMEGLFKWVQVPLKVGYGQWDFEIIPLLYLPPQETALVSD